MISETAIEVLKMYWLCLNSLVFLITTNIKVFKTNDARMIIEKIIEVMMAVAAYLQIKEFDNLLTNLEYCMCF